MNRFETLKNYFESIPFAVEDSKIHIILGSLFYDYRSQARWIRSALFRGVPGSGKTDAAQFIGRAFDMQVIFRQITDDMTEDELILTLLPDEDTPSGIRMEPGVLVQAIEASHERDVLLLLDEFDKANERMDACMLDFIQNARVNRIGLSEEQMQGDPTKIFVILTSNDRREISPPLKRRLAYVEFIPPSPIVVGELMMKYFAEENQHNFLRILPHALQIYEQSLGLRLSKPVTIHELRNFISAVLDLSDIIDDDMMMEMVRTHLIKGTEDFEIYRDAEALSHIEFNPRRVIDELKRASMLLGARMERRIFSHNESRLFFNELDEQYDYDAKGAASPSQTTPMGCAFFKGPVTTDLISRSLRLVPTENWPFEAVEDQWVSLNPIDLDLFGSIGSPSNNINRHMVKRNNLEILYAVTSGYLVCRQVPSPSWANISNFLSWFPRMVVRKMSKGIIILKDDLSSMSLILSYASGNFYTMLHIEDCERFALAGEICIPGKEFTLVTTSADIRFYSIVDFVSDLRDAGLKLTYEIFEDHDTIVARLLGGVTNNVDALKACFRLAYRSYLASNYQFIYGRETINVRVQGDSNSLTNFLGVSEPDVRRISGGIRDGSL